MMLKPLTRIDGRTIWINPDHVISVIAAGKGYAEDISTRISMLDAKFELVTEAPDQVVLLLT